MPNSGASWLKANAVQLLVGVFMIAGMYTTMQVQLSNLTTRMNTAETSISNNIKRVSSNEVNGAKAELIVHSVTNISKRVTTLTKRVDVITDRVTNNEVSLAKTVAVLERVIVSLDKNTNATSLLMAEVAALKSYR